MARHTESAFETVIEACLLKNGYTPVAREGFDRERAMFPEQVLAFIRETQPKEWAKLEALHGPAGRTYRTAHLWEEVLQRDSLLDLLARFIHLQVEEKRDDQGRKVKTESMIFPRYHQLQAVRMLVDAARNEGVGHNYLVEHSAGSGKSNTIG